MHNISHSDFYDVLIILLICDISKTIISIGNSRIPFTKIYIACRIPENCQLISYVINLN